MTELAPPPARVSAAGLAPDAAGVTPPSDLDRHGAFLTDVIVELGFADRETVEKVEEESRRAMQSIERVLLAGGTLDEEQLSRAIAERNGLDHVDLGRFEVDVEAAEMIGRSAALRYRAAPIAFAADGALIVAVEDPYNSLAISDIEAIARTEVRPVIATASGIQGLIERLPEEPAMHAPPPAPEVEAEAEEQPESIAAPPLPPQMERLEAPRMERPEAPVVDQPEPPVVSQPDPPPPPERAESPQPVFGNGGEPRDGRRRDRSADLVALREAVRRADALAGAVGERIVELEGAGDRAQRLERELAAAQERIAALEQRLSRFAGAAGEAMAAIDRLSALQRVLEETRP